MAHETNIYVASQEPARWEIDGDVAVCEVDHASSRSIAADHPPRLMTNDQRGIRKRFLQIQQEDVADLLKFLNRTGVWERGRRRVPLAEFWKDQETIRYLLTDRKPEKFTESKRSIQTIFERELVKALYVQSVYHQRWLPLPPTIELAVSGTRGTLYLSVWQDLARKARFRYCAREDCPDYGPLKSPFEVTRPDKVYCGQYCAHLVSLRNQRARKKRKRRKS
jgi:hypothetical protein